MTTAATTPPRDASLIEMLRTRLSAADAELSTLPVVAQKILAIASSPDCSLQELEELIARDPVIASKIVQMANSSFYRGLADAHSLPQAIMRLGFNEVHNVTLLIAMQQVYAVEGRYAAEMRRLWSASIAGAAAARELARAARYPRADEAFLAALVRDLGCVFIVQSLVRMGETDPRIASLPESIFRELVDVTHADLGADLLLGLGFSEGIVGAVRCHHEPERHGVESKLAWILAAADLVVTKLGLDGAPPDPDLLLSNRPSLQALGLGDIEIARALVDLEEMLDEMLGVLR